MDWDAVEDAIRAHIETAWALSDHAAIPLVWENEFPGYQSNFMAVIVEGTYADKTIYGSAGKRVAIEGGVVFFHAFVDPGIGKRAASGPVVAMTEILELQTIGTAIQLDGGNPPSPVADGPEVAAAPPGGAYYRCSGSVPFIVIGTR